MCKDEFVDEEHICYETPHEQLCDDALKHYEELAAECCHWSSIVPQAIRFYKKYGNQTGNNVKFDLGEVVQKHPEIIRDELDKEIIKELKKVYKNDENHITWDGRNYKACEEFIGKNNYDNTLNYPNILTKAGAVRVRLYDTICKDKNGEVSILPWGHRMMNKVGYTAGVFDLFHIGHLNILKNAKGLCDKLIVGVTTDELSKQRKKKGAVIPFAERIEIVRNIKVVDAVVPQDNTDKYAMWEQLKFDIIFVGDDWYNTDIWKEYEKKFNNVGVKVVYFPYTKTTSSTIIKKQLKE